MEPSHSALKKVWRRLEPFWGDLYSRTVAAPPLDTLNCILVLGNQKTGSTAIAQLLAMYGGLSITSDVPAGRHVTDLMLGNLSARQFIDRHYYYFKRDVVKDNSLTFACDQLVEALPSARFVYISRHPVQNIRSILDRLNLPGSPQPLDSLRFDPNWEPILRNEGLSMPADDHITALSKRWTRASALFEQQQEHFRCIRYEDFTADKISAIESLARELGVSKKGDIRPFVDVQYQKRGQHRDTDPADFFDQKALNIINAICEPYMATFDYHPIS